MMMMMRLSAETTQVRGTTYRGEGRIRLGEVCSVPQQLFYHRIVPAHHCSHKTGQPTLISKCERVIRAMKYAIGRRGAALFTAFTGTLLRNKTVTAAT